MKPFGPSQAQFSRMFRPRIPSIQQLFANQLKLNRLKRKSSDSDKPIVHTEPREGVYYQLHEEEQQPVSRMMGFREWCDKVYEPSRSSNTHPETAR